MTDFSTVQELVLFRDDDRIGQKNSTKMRNCRKYTTGRGNWKGKNDGVE
ncbi:MAG: hypothetical protein MUF37_04715 [Methanoregulaceae archaeon]|nr:hypothetical protein [Methanoregulaceae archaeon]